VIDESDIRLALMRCVGYDPVHFPKPSEVMLAAWIEHFRKFPKLERQNLIDAVAKYYDTPQRPVPQPADISVIARSFWRDEYDRGLHRDEQEALCDSKSEPDEIERRRAVIGRFVGEIGKIGPAVKVPAESIAEIVARQRASAPPQPIPEGDM